MQGEIFINTVIENIYKASYKPEHWPAALKSIALFTGSNSAALFYKDNEIEHLNCSCVYNIPEGECNACGIDPNFHILAEHAPVGTAAAIDHIYPDRDELEKVYGEKFNSFLAGTNMYYFAGSILFHDNASTSGICLQRTKAMGPWTKSQINTLNPLIPHLQRALIIQQEFVRLQMREQALRSGLDRLLMGLILFDKELHPIYLNPVAESILQYHPAISMINGKLHAYEDSDTEKIHAALTTAIFSKAGVDATESSTSLGLKHPNCQTIIPAVISHVQGILHGFETGGQFAYAAMYFSDPDRTHPIEADQLSDIYGITPAESQVAISIANGINPEEIANINNVAISTIRSQLKAIYHKLGVKSQAELVKALLTGPFGQSM